MLTIPGRCWLCDLPLACPTWGLCSCCTAAIPEPLPACPQCGLPALSSPLPCGRCIRQPPPWDSLVCVGDFTPPLRGLIHDLKFNAQPGLAPALARLLLLKILHARNEQRLILPHRLVSIPLHQRRAFSRGYNQSALLAAPLSRWLSLPYSNATLIRNRASQPQHLLCARQRQANLKGAFSVEIPLTDHHIAIVDDVVTTGNTVAEIARLLKKQGATTVQVWCLCRTL